MGDPSPRTGHNLRKMRRRLPEGKVVTEISELEEIGFDLFRLDMASSTVLEAVSPTDGYAVSVDIDWAFPR